MKTRRYKVSTIIEALEKNGYPWIQNNLRGVKGDGKIGLCAIGQIAVNLGCDSYNFEQIAGFGYDINKEILKKFDVNIPQINDTSSSYAEVVERVKLALLSNRDRFIEITHGIPE